MSTHEVPWLRSGVGRTPADGGCIMQVIDWVHSGGWTDRPECVSPVLQALAIGANDSLDDDGRQRLLDLAPRLIGTAGDGRVDRLLACWCVEQVLPGYEAARDDRPRQAVQAARDYAPGPHVEAAWEAAWPTATWEVWPALAGRDVNTYAAAWAATLYDPADVMGLLTGCLDEYDRLTGRTTTADVDWTPVCEVMRS